MKCLPQTKESLELQATEANKRETVLGFSGICSFVRLRDLDSNTDDGQLNGCYNSILRMALNISYKDHVTNEDLYGNLP